MEQNNFKNKFATYNMVEPPQIDKSFFNVTQEEEPQVLSNPIVTSKPSSETSTTEIPQDTQIKQRAKKVVKKVAQKTTTDIPITKTFSDKADFVNTMTKVYEKVLFSKGLSTSYAKKLVAQDGLESGWGKHHSGKNNFGGIKGKGTTVNTTEEIKGVKQRMKQEFRDFDSLEEYATYKVNLLNNSRYHAFDGGDFFANIVKGGYATSSTYLQGLIKTYNSIS